MSAHTLAQWLQSFMNNFPNLLHNSSSIKEILHVSPQEYYMNLTSLRFGLIWTWQDFGGRHFVGHSGSVPGLTHIMLTNEKRTLGAVVLTNGDTIKGDSLAKEIGETIGEFMNQLFDCFEKK